MGARARDRPHHQLASEMWKDHPSSCASCGGSGDTPFVYCQSIEDIDTRFALCDINREGGGGLFIISVLILT